MSPRTPLIYKICLAIGLALLLAVPVWGALTSQRGDWPAPTYSEGEAEAAVTQLEEILRQREFFWETQEPPFWRVWLDRLFDFLLSLLPDGSTSSPVISFLIALAGGVALLLVLLYAGRRLFGSLAPGETQQQVAHPEEDLTSTTAGERAETLSGGGDYRSAVRYLYLSALLHLDEKGLLRYDRSLTNREYLQRVAERPDLAASLRAVVDVFDSVWYGFQPVDEKRYQQYQAQVQRLRGLA